MGNKTALYDCHQKAGAKFVDFGGWDMPVRYSGTLGEHEAVRTRAGLFDVSHMGEVVVTEPEALDAVNRLITNDLHRIADGRAQYTAMCTPDGGIVDDLIVYRVSSEELFLCVNASNREKDFEWIQSNLSGDATARDESDEWSQIALQGPEAMGILGEVLPGEDWDSMRPFRFRDVPWRGASVRVATTGYTGSGGVNLSPQCPRGPDVGSAAYCGRTPWIGACRARCTRHPAPGERVLPLRKRYRYNDQSHRSRPSMGRPTSERRVYREVGSRKGCIRGNFPKTGRLSPARPGDRSFGLPRACRRGSSGAR